MIASVDTDNELLAALRSRAADPLTRTDVHIRPSPPLSPVATPRMIAGTEAAIGRPLPSFLRRIYAEVANGGFGPGYGMVALTDRNGSERSLSSLYRGFKLHGWPEDLLPLWDWGDAVWSCIDSGSPEDLVVTHDEIGSTPTVFTLRSWLGSWVEGIDLWKEIYEDKEATIINPFTGRPVTTKVRGMAKGR